jgi:hypothetical protein
VTARFPTGMLGRMRGNWNRRSVSPLLPRRDFRHICLNAPEPRDCIRG